MRRTASGPEPTPQSLTGTRSGPLTAPAAARPGRPSLRSCPRHLAGIIPLTCCCVPTITGRLMPRSTRPVQPSSTGPASGSCQLPGLAAGDDPSRAPMRCRHDRGLPGRLASAIAHPAGRREAGSLTGLAAPATSACGWCLSAARATLRPAVAGRRRPEVALPKSSTWVDTNPGQGPNALLPGTFGSAARGRAAADYR